MVIEMEKTTCPVCDKGKLQQNVGNYDVSYKDRKGFEGVLRLPNITRLRCDECGEEILDNIASSAIEDARRHASGLLSASEIRDLRVQLRKTQTEMADFLGVGEKTYCRWESGSYVQSVAFDNYLRLVRDVPACVVRLNDFQVAGIERQSEDIRLSAHEFTYLPDPSGLFDQEANFVRQLVTGQLHACRA